MLGACALSSAAINSRSPPINIAALIRDLQREINSAISAPLANPPAIQMAERVAISDAAAACGLVALESSTQLISSLEKMFSMRWRPNLNF